MVLGTECIEESHKDHEVVRSKVYAWNSGWSLVIWCDCGVKSVLTGAVAAAECDASHSLTAGEDFYSWLEDYPQRLEGKETRRDYYARLEEQAVPR
jgi:hypothetical protein